MLYKIILSIYTVALSVFSGLLVVTAIAEDWVQPHRWLEDALGTTRGRWTVGLIGAVFFAASVQLIVGVARRGGGQPVVHETSMGLVSISLDAVENLVKKVARSIKGVREIKAVIAHTKEGLTAHLRGTISPEVSIPEVSEEIQTSVRQYVKRVVGVELVDIRIEVENIAADGHRRRLD